MNLSTILHRPTSQFIYPLARNQLYIQLQTAAHDVANVTLLYWPRYETDRMKICSCPLSVTLRDTYRDTYRTTITTEGISAYLRYCFKLEADGQTLWYGRQGFHSSPPEMDGNFFEFLWPNLSDGYRAPEWSSRQIYYQIFPERFCNSVAELTPPDAVPWGSTPTRENFMGGDLPGITQKLGYLQELGITCLYLTPIFYGSSNHKYDTVDYYQIDPQFGTVSDLHALVDAAHQKGIRILLDGVFNHCGYYFGPFQDLLKHGSQSAYAHWFFPHSYPVRTDPCNYDCVGHYKWMPKLNLANPEAARYFIDVGKYWIREFDIDGWRLDVADEVPTAFWEAFSAALKQQNPNILLLGETWGDAERLVCQNRLDSAMNYLFKDAVTSWIAQDKISASEFNHLANQMLSLYPTEVDLRMYNPLDSHDTPRFLFSCGQNIEKLKLAVALQMTFPGCPAIFYGDEVGVTGDNDPLCRQAMPWPAEKQNQSLFRWYQQLIALRKSSVSLCEGNYQAVLCDDTANLYAFTRATPLECTLVLIHPDTKRKVTCPDVLPKDNKAWQQVFPPVSDSSLAERSASNRIVMPPCSVKIYQQKEKVQNV